MLKMVDGTGIIGVDMICPLGVSTPQPPNYDRVELEGTGILVLPNSLDAPLERLELGGKTEQVTTTGKNLANPSEFVIGTLAVDTGNVINLKQYITTGYIPAIPGKRYSASRGNKFLAHTIIAYDKEKTIINYPMNMSSEMPEGAAYIRLSCKKIDMTNVTESDMEELKKVYMVNEGSTVLPYEPYTGGKPSPSPEYPQEIKNVGKWNEGTQKYEVDVNITGKNLFDKCLLEGGEIVEFNGVECYKYKDDSNNFKYKGKFKNGQQYALTTRILRPESKKSYGTYIKFKYEDGTDSVLYAEHGGLKTLVSNIGKTIDSIIGNYNYATDCYLDLSVTRLSRGGQDSGYQPYKEQTLTLTSDRPLTKWDRLVEQGGEIGWLYKHKIIEDFSMLVKDTEPIYGNDGGKYFSVSLQNASLNYDRSKIYSEVGTHGKDNKIHYIPKPMMANVIIYVSDTDTIMTAKEHMHYKVIYETIESQFVPLPQSEQSAIRALKTYYPTTVITADGGELDPDIKVTYRKEI